MSIIQLDPPIPLYCVSKNEAGWAMFLIDYSQEHNLKWVTFMDSGECWTLDNTDIRAVYNPSMGRVPE